MYRISTVVLFFIFFKSGWTQNIRIHDPVAIENNGSFYLFSTGFGIAAKVSTDLIHWEDLPPVFPTKPKWTDLVVPGFKNHIWAPDVIHFNDQFYLFYSVSSFGKNTSAIGLAINKSLDSKDKNYQWIDQGIIVRSIPNRDNWNAIDPNIIVDESNTPWMSFGSFWGGIKMVKMNPELNGLSSPEEWYTLARRARSFDFQDNNAGDAAIEAPFIYKHGNYYYLFVSWDLCCRGQKSTYKVVVGRSKNVMGPYLDQSGIDMFDGGGTLLLEGNSNWYGVGHNSVYNFNNETFLFAHAYDAKDNGKSKLKIFKLQWNDDGWPYIPDYSSVLN